jgi:septal ring factor EnvC (AmiA/AmiB activator)
MNLRGLLVLAALASASAMKSKAAVLVELDTKPMGNALLSTIHLQLETGAPVDEIVGLLSAIKGDLLAQQTAADELHKSREEYCAFYSGTYSANIESAKTQIAYNEGVLEVSRPALDNTNVLISDNETRLASLEAERVRAAKQREEEKNTWAFYDEEYKDSIAAVYEALDIVTDLKYKGGSELIQIRMSEVQRRISKSMNKFQNNLYGPSVAALAQLATSADQKTVDRIRELLSALAKDLTAAQGQDTDSENQKQAIWEGYDSDLHVNIEGTKNTLADLRNRKASLEATIAKAEEDLAAAKAKKASNEELLAQLNAQCENWRSVYHRETAER